MGPVAVRVYDSDARGGRNIDGLGVMSIRARIESRNHLVLRHAAAIQIGLIGAVGLLLAALHGVEDALWAAAYWWLGAFNSPTTPVGMSAELSLPDGGIKELAPGIAEHSARMPIAEGGALCSCQQTSPTLPTD